MPVASERASLVRALSAVAVTERRKKTRRFLEGLSTSELRYIASYLGACLLESALYSDQVSRRQIASDIAQYECRRCGSGCGFSGDVEHQMILLLEYLSACRRSVAVNVVAGSA